VSRYQQGKIRKVCTTNLDLLEQEVSGSGISWVMCKSAPLTRQITMPESYHSVFTGWMPFLLPNQQRQSTEGTSTEGTSLGRLDCKLLVFLVVNCVAILLLLS